MPEGPEPAEAAAHGARLLLPTRGPPVRRLPAARPAGGSRQESGKQKATERRERGAPGREHAGFAEPESSLRLPQRRESTRWLGSPRVSVQSAHTHVALRFSRRSLRASRRRRGRCLLRPLAETPAASRQQQTALLPGMAWQQWQGPPPSAGLDARHVRGGLGGPFGAPFRVQHRRPQGGRLGGPRRFGGPPQAMDNLPIPPGALSDPWDRLFMQHAGAPLPLEAPTEELLRQLQAEVARQERLSRLTGHEREAPPAGGGPTLFAAQGVPSPGHDSSEPQDTSDRQLAPDEGVTQGCEEGGPQHSPPSRAPEALQGGSPLKKASCQSRPLVLPPPCFDSPAAAAAADGAAGDEGTRQHASGPYSGSGLAAITTEACSDRGPPAVRGPRGFRLPAVSGAGGGASGAPEGTASLQLDELRIKKKLQEAADSL
ncbi:hypothetical protein Efla_005589 [Eimeria flavescens]